jgi:hypothetical protein
MTFRVAGAFVWCLLMGCSSGGGGGGPLPDGGTTGGSGGLGGSGGSATGGSGGTGGTGGAAGTGTGGGSSSPIACGAITDDSCYCSVADPGQGNDEPCSPTQNASGGYCCGGVDWPSQGDCLCGPMLCNFIGETCMCGRALWESGDPSCTGTYCCLTSIGGCDCGPDPCQSGQTQVPQCDSSVFNCGDSQVMIAACK